MSDSGKHKKISDDVNEMSRYAEEQRLGHGQIEFDELGNAIWVPYSGAAGADVMQKLLHDPNLAITNDYTSGTTKRVESNPQGLKKGYDPYDSGMLVKKQWKKGKDLRRLSEWIKSKKKAED